MMFLLELLVDLIADCWFGMMQWIVPKRAFGKKARIVLRVLACVFSCGLLFLMIIGAFALISASISQDPVVRRLGRCLVFIPLAVGAVQILLGIIVRFCAKK